MGHLFRAGFGPTPGNLAYGYGATRKEASQKARDEYKKHISIAPAKAGLAKP